MENEYIAYLYQQYCRTIGKKSKLIDFNSDFDDFVRWIRNNQLLGEYYKTYIEFLGIDFNTWSLFEANKGKYDSIIDNSVYMISPFASTVGGTDMRIYNHHGDVVIADEKKLYASDEIGIQTIITQNPYSIDFIEGFKSMHEHGKDICIGIFGGKYDSDRLNKERLMMRLYDSTDGVNISYDTIDGKYLCALKSDRKVKVKKKIYVK